MKICYYAHFDQPSDCENWIAHELEMNEFLVYRYQRNINEFNNISNWNLFKNFLQEKKIEILLINKAPEITLDMINEIKEINIKVVYWTFDYMLQPGIKEWFIPIAQACDLVFMTDGTDRNSEYKNLNINRYELHQGAGYIHYPEFIKSEIHSCDVAFLGSRYTSERKNLVDFLSNLDGITFKTNDDARFEQGVWNKDFRLIMSNAKIVIGDNFRNDIHGYWSDRVYLSLACGACFLTRYVPGLENVFEIDKHLMTWKKYEDLEYKIRYLLNHNDKRETLSNNGRNYVSENHRYENRILKFKKKIREII